MLHFQEREENSLVSESVWSSGVSMISMRHAIDIHAKTRQTDEIHDFFRNRLTKFPFFYPRKRLTTHNSRNFFFIKFSFFFSIDWRFLHNRLTKIAFPPPSPWMMVTFGFLSVYDWRNSRFFRERLRNSWLFSATDWRNLRLFPGTDLRKSRFFPQLVGEIRNFFFVIRRHVFEKRKKIFQNYFLTSISYSFLSFFYIY